MPGDNLVTPNDSGLAYLIDNNGVQWPVIVEYTTDGNSDVQTLGGEPVMDNLQNPPQSGNAWLTDNEGRVFPARVAYTTDGNGNVIPISASGPGSGTVWYNGNGVPSDSLGQNGDYYLDDLTGDVYAKTGGSWV